MPYKNILFLTNKIESFDLVDKLIKDAMHGLNLNNNLPKKIEIFFIKYNGTVVKPELDSKSAVAKFLDV